MTHLDRWRLDFGATQHGQRAASVRLPAVLHRDNRRLHLYACGRSSFGGDCRVAHFLRHSSANNAAHALDEPINFGLAV
jgi:hypothetical protein